MVVEWMNDAWSLDDGVMCSVSSAISTTDWPRVDFTVEALYSEGGQRQCASVYGPTASLSFRCVRPAGHDGACEIIVPSIEGPRVVAKVIKSDDA